MALNLLWKWLFMLKFTKLGYYAAILRLSSFIMNNIEYICIHWNDRKSSLVDALWQTSIINPRVVVHRTRIRMRSSGTRPIASTCHVGGVHAPVLSLYGRTVLGR